jgi:hypothetical protein
MVDTLARVKSGTHIYPTRVAALIRRDLVSQDARRLTRGPASHSDGGSLV